MWFPALKLTEGFSSQNMPDTFSTQNSDPEIEASLASPGSDSFTVTDEVPRDKKDAQQFFTGLYVNANQTAKISDPGSLCRFVKARSSAVSKHKKKGKWI